MNNIKKIIKNLPQETGVYQFFDINKNLLYVGKSVSIKKRVSSYFSNKNLGPKTNELVKNINYIKYIKVFSEFEALLLESDLIRQRQPFYNIIAKDDKSPIYIKITKSKVPIIEVTRKPENFKNDFVKGPFPSTKTTKEILRLIRKIFPYCQHKNPKKPCLYVHLGICPYPYESEKTRLKYQKDITKIKKLLTGKSNILIRNLQKEMDRYSKSMQYEEAQNIKNQIQKLEYLKTTYYPPKDFLATPALVDDLILARLVDLQKVLGLNKIPRRLECYDISNIQGKYATGSMVVFINGASAKDQYRRFKIKFTKTPNDFEMLKEVLARRFKNDWPKPDLIIIDGGKGQLSSVVSIVQKYSIQTPIISLAKRYEEIYTDKSNIPIKLTQNSPALQLVQAIRDEAHRFAITYHKLLRSKAFLNYKRIETINY